MKDKIKYEKPKLIALNGDVGVTKGACQTGSSDVAACWNGASAGACGAGASPGISCKKGSAVG